MPVIFLIKDFFSSGMCHPQSIIISKYIPQKIQIYFFVLCEHIYTYLFILILIHVHAHVHAHVHVHCTCTCVQACTPLPQFHIFHLPSSRFFFRFAVAGNLKMAYHINYFGWLGAPSIRCILYIVHKLLISNPSAYPIVSNELPHPSYGELSTFGWWIMIHDVVIGLCPSFLCSVISLTGICNVSIFRIWGA